jgi:hypothetical protein
MSHHIYLSYLGKVENNYAFEGREGREGRYG